MEILEFHASPEVAAADKAWRELQELIFDEFKRRLTNPVHVFLEFRRYKVPSHGERVQFIGELIENISASCHAGRIDLQDSDGNILAKYIAMLRLSSSKTWVSPEWNFQVQAIGVSGVEMLRLIQFKAGKTYVGNLSRLVLLAVSGLEANEELDYASLDHVQADHDLQRTLDGGPFSDVWLHGMNGFFGWERCSGWREHPSTESADRPDGLENWSFDEIMADGQKSWDELITERQRPSKS